MVPYEAEPFVIRCHDVLPVTVAVPWPHRSWVTKIVINQIDGSPTTFNVDLFNHADALEGTEVSASASSGERMPEGIHKIDKTIASDSAGLLEYFSENQNGGSGMVFCNMDKTPNKTPVQKLYFRLSPTSNVGETAFAVALGGISALD